MSNLVKVSSNEMIVFTQDQIDLIKSQVAAKATADELQLFLYHARRTGLDPLAKQVHCVHRTTKDPKTKKWVDKMTIQTGIDGFRVIANRSGEYAGQDEPEFVYRKDENGKDVLNCAKVRVYKFDSKGNRYQAAVGVAYWDEYVVTVDEYNDAGDRTGKKVPGPMWKKMPHGQLAKVAEALALRKAFPQDLSGIYTHDEMEQADMTGETLRAAEDIQIKESLEELQANYDEWLDEYKPLVKEDEYKKVLPENWKAGDKTQKKTWALAIDALKQRVYNAKNPE